MNSLSVIFCLCAIFVLDSHCQELKLKIEPIFEFVNENWTIGRALPDLSICVHYTGVKQLTLSITNGDTLGYFYLSSVNNSCWTLIVQKQLDADLVNPDGSRGQSFSLALKCTDGRVQAYGNLDIQVVDINDNAPRFVDTESALSIAEDSEIGLHLITVTTFDPDTGVGGINSFLLEDDFHETFEIRNGSCNDAHCFADVHLLQTLNYDRKNIYTLNVIAFDGAGRSQIVNVAKFPIVINVADVENNPPRFITDARISHVPEDAPLGTGVVQIQAIDGDVGVVHSNRILYKLQTPSTYFDINATTGWIFVKHPLDRESPDILKSGGSITLQIQAEEDTKTQPRPQSVLTTTLLITDVDDEPPRCNLTLYNAKITENSQRLVPLSFTNAQDLYVYDNDEGPNGEFTLSLLGVNDVFDITPKRIYNVGTAVIRVHNSSGLDYEQRQLFGFKVVLTPSSQNARQSASFCDVIVRVLDANDNPPMFNQTSYVGKVDENMPIGTVVTYITVYDLDGNEFSQIIFKLKGVGSDQFAIDSNGTVKTNAILDREKVAEYHLTVLAIDDNGKGNSNTTNLKIFVVDNNDNAPKFTKTIFVAYLSENSLDFNLLGNGFFVEATDDDQSGTENSNITYQFQPGYGVQNFTLNPITGQIIPKPPGIDLEEMSDDYFNLSVIAKDNNKARPLSGVASVMIYVNDTNDNEPMFSQQIYNVSVYENITSNAVVARVLAEDEDRSHFNSLVAYRIANIQDKFAIDSETGAISIVNGATLDQNVNRQNQYTLDVLAIDQGFPSKTGSTQVLINVVDINDKPPRFVDKLYHVDVLENVPSHTLLANLSAVDPDVGARLVYHIVGYVDAQKEDGSVVDQNEYNYTNLFFIKPFTGELITAKNLDRELMEHVTLYVNVTDVAAEKNKPQTAQAIVDIIILDVNDNRPNFVKSEIVRTVQENAEIGSIIMTVSAWDPDKNRSISYSLKENSSKLVKIDEFTGELTVSDLIDFEAIQTINFTVLATDSGVPPLTSSNEYFLKVMDQNDNSPSFNTTRYTATIAENANNGTFVLSVKATDKDSGSFGKVNYFLLNDVSTPAPFVINSTTGLVTVNGFLDRETKNPYSLTVKAVDDYAGHLNPDSHETTTVIMISLIDVNDNAPQFVPTTSKTLILTEKNQAGMQVIVLTATDADDPETGNGQVQYFIVGGNASVLTSTNEKPKSMFILDSENGSLKLSVNLTGLYGFYNLIVSARDKGIPNSISTNETIFVDVQDFNDHPPKIWQPTKQALYPVSENNYTDYYVVLQIRASDKDHGKNAALRFRLKPTVANEDWKYFTVNEISGEVYLKQALDYERQHHYALTAEACDEGQPILCDEVEFAIVVIDKDDNCPYFKRHQNFSEELNVQENLPSGSVVGAFMEALDKDSSAENIHICYDIVGGDGATLFSFSSRNSTKILTKSILDREAKSYHELVVRASDCHMNQICGGKESSFSSNEKISYKSSDNSLLSIRVQVTDMNDNPPAFVQQLFIGGVQYDTKIGSRVTRIKASDADIVDQGKLSYYMVGSPQIKMAKHENLPNRDPFVVNSSSGDINTAILFSPNWKGSFEFIVGVNDTNKHSATSKVVINLLSFDQQVELMFDSNANQLWDDAYKIMQLLSLITESNATIDDVQAYQKENSLSPQNSVQSKVLVHFVGTNSEIMPVENSLQLLDMPKATEQKRAKQELITNHRLKYAGHNPDPLVVIAGDETTMHYGLSGALAGLLLVLIVLISIWCFQNRIYKRRLKAATAVAFSNSGDLTIPSYDVPGTNLHANTNPVWTPTYDADNFATDFETHSQGSKNSLDENEVEQDTDANYVLSSENIVPRMVSHKHSHEPSVRQHQRTMNNLSSEKSFVCNVNHRTLSPQPNYPQPIMSNLESTEL